MNFSEEISHPFGKLPADIWSGEMWHVTCRKSQKKRAEQKILNWEQIPRLDFSFSQETWAKEVQSPNYQLCSWRCLPPTLSAHHRVWWIWTHLHSLFCYKLVEPRHPASSQSPGTESWPPGPDTLDLSRLLLPASWLGYSFVEHTLWNGK